MKSLPDQLPLGKVVLHNERKLIMNKIAQLIMIGLLLSSDFLHAKPEQARPEIPQKLWGYTLSSEAVDLVGSKKDKAERDKIIRQLASLESKTDTGLNHRKSTALILLGYYQVDDSVELIIDNLDHLDRKTKSYPAKHALAAYGEKALPKIIAAFEKGLTGKRAAQAVSAVKEIKGEDFINYTISLKSQMSEKAFNEFLRYPAD